MLYLSYNLSLRSDRWENVRNEESRFIPSQERDNDLWTGGEKREQLEM